MVRFMRSRRGDQEKSLTIRSVVVTQPSPAVNGIAWIRRTVFYMAFPAKCFSMVEQMWSRCASVIPG